MHKNAYGYITKRDSTNRPRGPCGVEQLLFLANSPFEPRVISESSF